MTTAELITTDARCDLIRMERTNMVTKMEDRVKVDLVAMSKMIISHLRQCDDIPWPYTDEVISKLAVQFNQGALVQYQYGEIERAEILCRAEIELFARLSMSGANRALCLASMVAPYVNLARIYGQKGEVEESLNIFENVYRLGVQRQDLSILGHQIQIEDGPNMFAAGPGCQKLMLSCRVIETARVLQTIEDYPALLALVEENEVLPEYQDTFFKQYLLEVRSRALLNTGRYEEALSTFQQCCQLMSTTNTDRIVAHLFLSQLYREWGRDDLARDTLAKLEEYFAAIEHYGRKLPILRQIAYRIALERHLMGDDDKAVGPAEKAFKWCSELSDQPGCIKTAILLLRVSARTNGHYEPQRRWYDELQQLAANTFFRLERACAYWELGLSTGVAESDEERMRQSACEFLQLSYDLYRSVPFVDSRKSCAAVKHSLDSRAGRKPANGAAIENSSDIDAVFDALMEYAPNSFVASQ
jgi:tetratricopeptide (TPR) repeat protein